MLACAEAPTPPRRPLWEGVLALFWVKELAPPKVNGWDGVAGVVMEAGAAVPAVPNMPPVVELLAWFCERPPNGLLCCCNDVAGMVVEAGATVPAAPNMPPVVELLVWFCERPPNGLLCGGCAPNPPKAGAEPAPFIPGVEFNEVNGLLPPLVKLKAPVGGWGLKPELEVLPPKAGNEEVVKVLLAADDCAGGKLFATLPPNALLPPKSTPLALLLVGAGAEAPKLKAAGWGVLKLVFCDTVCLRGLAIAV